MHTRAFTSIVFLFIYKNVSIPRTLHCFYHLTILPWGVFCGFLFSLFYTVFQNQLLTVLGAKPDTVKATADYLLWTTTFGAIPAILNVVMAQMVRAEGAALHASIGTMSVL